MLRRYRITRLRHSVGEAIVAEAWPRALKQLEKWRRLDDADVTPFICLAEVYTKTDQPEACRVACLRGLELKPTASPLLRRLGNLAFADAHYQQARDYFTAAQKEAKDPERLSAEIARCDDCLRKAIRDSAEEARELYRDGHYDEAERIARQALSTDENNAHLLLVLGDVRSRAGDLAEAIELFQRCLPLHKDPARVRLRLLDVLLQSSRWIDARELWISAARSEREALGKTVTRFRSELGAEAELAEVPDEVHQPQWLAWWLFYQMAAPLRECEQTLLRLFRGAEESGRVSLLLTAMAEAEALPDGLRRQLREGVQLWLRRPIAGMQDLRVATRWISGRASAAAASPVLKLLGRVLLGHVLSGLRQVTGDPEKEDAVELLLRVEQVFPKDAQVVLSLGDAFMRLRRIDDAVSAYEKALKIHKNPERVRLRLLTAHVQSGNWTEVMKWRECMESRWERFRAALACYEFDSALALGRQMVREDEPVSGDWLPAYLGLLFELNLMSDALAVLRKPGLGDAMTERYRFWLAWEGVGSDEKILDRLAPFWKSTDEGIQWCIQAIDLLESPNARSRQWASHLAKSPELASPLSAMGVELSARLGSASWKNRSMGPWRSLKGREWELMPYFVRSRNNGESFTFRVRR